MSEEVKLEVGPLVHFVICPGAYVVCKAFFREEDAEAEAERARARGDVVERHSSVLLYRQGDMVYHAHERPS